MAQTFRLHVVGLPHTQVNLGFTACAFTERVRKFCGMMSGLGHEVFLYAGPGKTDAIVTEHIECISEEERLAVVGDRHFVHASFDYGLPHWRRFNARVIKEIAQRKGERQFLCVIGGLAHKEIAIAHPDLRLVEFSIGYGGVIAESFKVFESLAWQHVLLGTTNANPNAIDGRYYDTCIPGSFDPDDFPFRAEKDDYFVFLGRLTHRKGIGTAVEACKRMGARFIIAGQGEPHETPDYGEYVGVIGPEERGRLLAGAKAAFVCATYVEPFGNSAVEAQLCGTPVLCSPFGAMTETVEDGKTGFHCHTIGEFIDGANRAGDLDADYIRQRAIDLYSTSAVAKKYDRHFRRLATLWGAGFYDLGANA
jgi:glycosyltransferase involved in cell wall biosynthesis